MRPELSVVIPLKDEREVLNCLWNRLRAVLASLDVENEVIFVDDGSVDGTAHFLCALARRERNVRVIELSRNFGHQAAVTAGLDHARGRAVVVMDGDLQDPPELIPTLVEGWRNGNDVVYAVRQRREAPWPMRFAYGSFYRLLKHTAELDIPVDAGDFCLMDRRVVRAIRALPERSRFVRGLRSYVGFRQLGIPYDRPERAAGRSKYTLSRLFALASDGLVSFSSRPLRLATYLGLTTALVALGLLAWAIHDAVSARSAPRGWASTLVVVLFLGAVQLVCTGILGEYLRQIFAETKRRPTYIVARRTGGGAPSGGRRAIHEARTSATARHD